MGQGVSQSCCIGPDEEKTSVVEEEVTIVRTKRGATRVYLSPRRGRPVHGNAHAGELAPPASPLRAACCCEESDAAGSMEELQLWRTRCAAPGLCSEDPIIVVHPPLIAIEKLIQLESIEACGTADAYSWGSSCPWGIAFQESKLYKSRDAKPPHNVRDKLEEDKKPCGPVENPAGTGTSTSSRSRGPCASVQGCREYNRCQEFHLATAFCSHRGALLVFLLVTYVGVQQVLSSLALFPEAAAQTVEGDSAQLAASRDTRTEDVGGITIARFASIMFYELCGCLGFVFLTLLVVSVSCPDKEERAVAAPLTPADKALAFSQHQLEAPHARSDDLPMLPCVRLPMPPSYLPPLASPEAPPLAPSIEIDLGQDGEGASPSIITPCAPDAEARQMQGWTVTGWRSCGMASSTVLYVIAVTIISVGFRISYRLSSLAMSEDSVLAPVPEHGTLPMALGVADSVAAGLGPLLVVCLVTAKRLLPSQRVVPFPVAVFVLGTLLLQIAANIIPLMLRDTKANLFLSHWTLAAVASAAGVTAIAAVGGDAAASERPGAAACWVFVWGSWTLFLSNHLIVVIAPLLAAQKLLQAQGVLHALLVIWAALSSPMVSLMQSGDGKELPTRCYFVLHLLLSIYSRLVFIEAPFPSRDFALLLAFMCCIEFAQVSGLLAFGRAWVFHRCHTSMLSKEKQRKSNPAEPPNKSLDEPPGSRDAVVEETSVLRAFDGTWWLLRCESEAWMQGFASLVADIVAIAVATSENLLEVVHGRCLPEDCTQSDVSPPLTPTSEQIMRRWLFAALGAVFLASRSTQWLAGRCRRHSVQRFLASRLENGADWSSEFDAKHFFRQNYVWLVVCIGVVVVPAIGQTPVELQAIRQTGKQ